MIGRKTMRNFVGQWYHVKKWQKLCTETLKRVFLHAKEMASRNIFLQFFCANVFMFVLVISNHTVFLVQFEINLHLWVFQKAEIALAEAARAISAFWKTHSCKLIPNWTRNRMITYTYLIFMLICSDLGTDRQFIQKNWTKSETIWSRWLLGFARLSDLQS